MPQQSTTSRLAGIAQDQWGLLTRRQAEDAGVPARTLQRLVADSILDRVAHGVYRLSGAPTPDHTALRAAWLQLAPAVPVWARTPDQGVVSHRSAAALYGLGHLPADEHEFTLPVRRQSRRPDVHLHRGQLVQGAWIQLHGLPVTRPAQIARDLLAGGEDPAAVGHIITDALRGSFDYPNNVASAIAPYAARSGLRRGDGLALLRWLLDLAGDPGTQRWIDQAKAHLDRGDGSRSYRAARTAGGVRG